MTEEIFMHPIDRLRSVFPEQADAIIVPLADDNQNEMLSQRDQLLRFLTGFSGSAGTLILTRTNAHFFTDGRYAIQAKKQLDSTLFLLYDIDELTPKAWMKSYLAGKTLSADPWLHTVAEVNMWKEIGVTPVWQDVNLVATIWPNRPARTTEDIRQLGEDITGINPIERAAQIGSNLPAELDALFISDHAAASWLCGVRGTSVPHSGIASMWCLLHRDGRLDKAYTRDEALDLVEDSLGKIGYDPKSTPAILGNALHKQTERTVHPMADPCLLAKARKNPVELNGFRETHKLDAKAVISFLAWFASQQELDEQKIDQMLFHYRSEDDSFIYPSFPTIAGAGPNGAIIHYRATTESNRKIVPGDLVLIDSGGHYVAGTTDITRTVLAGSMQDTSFDLQDYSTAYTAVLRGLINISSITFPHGTTGGQIDAIARAPLWEIGQDYPHGTGHGVGHGLSVHEGPQGISKRNHVPLEAGMVVSLEPGLYIEDAFGIRLENLAIVREFGDMLGFETLTLVPFDRRLIRAELMSPAELEWINTYHAHVYHRVVNNISDEKACDWLAIATVPVENTPKTPPE